MVYINCKLKIPSPLPVYSTFYIFRQYLLVVVPKYIVHNICTRFVYVIRNIVKLSDIRKRLNETRVLILHKYKCVSRVYVSFYLYSVKNVLTFLRASVLQ